MVRPNNDELDTIISIALKATPAYELRSIVSPRGKLDRELAVQTLTSRGVAALRSYELTREPNAREQGTGTLPPFPSEI